MKEGDDGVQCTMRSVCDGECISPLLGIRLSAVESYVDKICYASGYISSNPLGYVLASPRLELDDLHISLKLIYNNKWLRRSIII